jgi:mannitol/fructose-specific phosphotransferase system IIA component (Ntr-type)
MNLTEILSPHAVKVPLEAADKKGAIDELIDVLAASSGIRDVRGLKDAVWQREQQRTTGIGEGLAIPHGKCASTSRLVMAVGRPAVPLEFDSVDRKPVKLIVLLASPPNKTSEHIQALGKISRIMANPAFRESVYNAQTPEELFELFRKNEAS